MTMFDLAIIGAGPGGADAAEYAAAQGLSVILFEKNKIGGVCLNEGCVPTKTLLHSAHIYAKANDGRKYGISANDVSLDMGKLMARKAKILKKLGAGIKMGLQKHDVVLVEGKATLVERTSEGFVLSSEDELYHAKNVILATGSEAFIPPIPGLNEVSYWTAREALQADVLPKSLAVIGGGVIGMEFVSFFSTMGVEVTVIEMLPKILGPMDRQIADELQAAFSKRGVKFHLSTRVDKIENGAIVAINAQGEELLIKAEQILISVGRRPVINDLGLETLKVYTERGAVVTDEYMRTNLDGLYAVGDINGRSMLAHTATREGVVAVNHILGHEDRMSYHAIPGVVYTDPEVASVGKTQQELDELGTSYEVHQVPMSMSGRFVIENEMVNGLCKILTSEEGVVLGVHMLGNTSSEILVPAIMAVDKKMTLDELAGFVFPHPTISEILRSAALH